MTGFFASDDFNIAETIVLNVGFGVVNYTALNLPNRGGVLGMGLDGFQTIAAQTGNPLPSILDLLKTQEVIDTTSFGITLGGRGKLQGIYFRAELLIHANSAWGSSSRRDHIWRLQPFKDFWALTSTPTGSLARPVCKTQRLDVLSEPDSR